MMKLLHYGAAAAFVLLISFTSGLAIAADAGENTHPVTVIRFFSNHGFVAPYEIANALGWLKPKGIEIKSVGFSQGGPENIFGVDNGSVDIAGAATASVINAIAGGAPIIGVNTNLGESKTTNSKFFVLADSPIKSAKDLKGKSIAVNTLGAHLDYVVRLYLKHHQMQPSDVQLVVVPGPQLDQVLRHKQVNVAAVGAWQSVFAGKIEAGGGVRVLFTAYDVLGPIMLDANVMKKSFIAQHPQTIRDFVTITAKAADWASTHLEKTREMIAEIYKNRGDNPEIAKYFTGYGLRLHALLTDHDAQFWIDALVQAGKLKAGQLTPAEVEVNKYNDLAHVAQK
jgi:ABC-type nitrate/sulfonate/bicarbonate transport system substrate-binding protein